MNGQCFHMSQDRSKEADEKIGIARIRTVFAWVVKNTEELMQSFTDEFRAKLRPEWGALLQGECVINISGQTPLSACAINAMASTESTSTTHIVTHHVPTKT